MIGGEFCPNCFSKKNYHEKHCPICGYVETGNRSAKALPLGYLLKKQYYIGRILGIGGFGITYLAYDLYGSDSRKIWAIKEYYPQEWAVRAEDGILLSPCGWAVEKVYRHGLEVFANEAKILQNMWNDHTIVNIKDFFQENNTAYLVMEYVKGKTLSETMQISKRPFSIEEANRIIQNVARSLDKIHSFGLLHRDVSPDNIMLQNNGNIKLIDFGATRQFVMNETTDMSVLIKPGFAPLEQYSRIGKQGPWTDVYALAATYYYMVTGKKPLTAVERYSGEKMKTLHQMNPNCPESISRVISNALKTDYTERTDNMQTFLKQLINAEHTKSSVTTGVPHVLMKTSRQNRKWKFNPDRSIKIGRSKEECDICILGNEISRVHCEIKYDKKNQIFIVTDYSANGTYTSRKRIGKNNCVALQPGEFIYLVEKKNRFYLEVK